MSKKASSDRGSTSKRILRLFVVGLIIVAAIFLVAFIFRSMLDRYVDGWYAERMLEGPPEPQAAIMTTPEGESEQAKVAFTSDVFVNDLVSPVLHHADSHAPEEGYGSFDIGVNEGQIGLVFGWHIRWPQGGVNTAKFETCPPILDVLEGMDEDAKDIDAYLDEYREKTGCGCGLVILTPGWYENLEILDGRYEVYDIPSSDYAGWVEVLGQQRADEQAAHYGCPEKSFVDLPQWESPISSPP